MVSLLAFKRYFPKWNHIGNLKKTEKLLIIDPTKQTKLHFKKRKKEKKVKKKEKREKLQDIRHGN